MNDLRGPAPTSRGPPMTDVLPYALPAAAAGEAARRGAERREVSDD